MKVARCNCPLAPEPHWKAVPSDDNRKPSTMLYCEPVRGEPIAPPPVPPNNASWQEPKGALECKNCGMPATPEQLVNCSRLICPSGPHGGYTDITNVIVSDMNWIEHAKKSRASNTKTPGSALS